MRRSSLISLAFLGTLVATPALADYDITLIGQYRDWNAFTYKEKGKKVCYISSSPINKLPKNVRRGDVYLMVTHRPEDNIKDEVSIIAGYTYRTKSTVTAEIGKAQFHMITEGDSAWTASAAEDRKLTGAMRKGAKMEVVGYSSRGTKTTDTYSLSGFTRAHNAISKACKVR